MEKRAVKVAMKCNICKIEIHNMTIMRTHYGQRREQTRAQVSDDVPSMRCVETATGGARNTMIHRNSLHPSTNVLCTQRRSTPQ